MMPKQLPSVMNDRGYQQEAKDFARNIMEGKGVFTSCQNFNEFPQWMQQALEKAYLHGAQSAIGIGYRLADNDYKETVKFYKKQIEELKKEVHNDKSDI